MTIKDIAKICGVGASTVSRAINNDPAIKPETRRRVMEVVRRYHFVPNGAARNLKLTESNTVGILCNGVNNPFFQSMFRYFGEELAKHDYSFLLHETDDEEDDAAIADALVRERHLKGIIFLGGIMENPAHTFRRIDVPYVLCSVALGEGESNCPVVSVNDEEESFKVVDYLCQNGHKKIAIITARRKDNTVGRLRLSGYKRALAKNGIKFDPALVGYMHEELPEYSTENGYTVMKELLSSGKKFTAVYAISDLTAFGAYKAIQESGGSIPEDYSVVGFDGIDMTRYMHPSLTTLRQPHEMMARRAVDLLLEALEGEESEPQRFLFEGDLLIRDSVRKI